MNQEQITKAAFLWSRGHDTRDIGDKLGIREHIVVAFINSIKEVARRDFAATK
jgi:DNA-binding CsgD family transcriptional regulator